MWSSVDILLDVDHNPDGLTRIAPRNALHPSGAFMTVEFIYDYRSPYSYLANSQLERLGAEITFKAIDVRAVMKTVNNQPSTLCPPKARYAGTDAGRWAKHYGIPFSPNRDLMKAMGAGTFDGTLLSRAGMAAMEIGTFDNAHTALFEAVWASAVDMTNDSDREAYFAQRGIDGKNLWSVASSAGIADRLAKNCSDAAYRGVFGVPAFFVGDELFFGNDRLNFVRAALHGTPVEGAAA
jgi:2-hydroxychromene-2-carboxylate isomerase